MKIPHACLLLLLTVNVAIAQPSPKFPLKLSADQRYLVDQRDQPFLVLGDSPWSLVVEPSPREVDLYLDDRKKKGFNVLLVNLIEHKFSSRPPKLRDGIAPFATPGDFGTPNDAYFDYAERVVAKAAKRGMTVLLCPAYLGFAGGDQGFFQEMLKSGRKKVRAYGQYVGRRFLKHRNVIWIVGGDFTPPRDKQWTVDEVAEGIRDEDKIHLMTVHTGPNRTAADDFGDRRWLDLNHVYDYRLDLYAACFKADGRKRRMPYFLLETAYEGEHQAKPERIRRQAYWPLLCGALGHVYGNSPMWHFGSRGLYDQGGDWKGSLNSRGAQDMQRLAQTFSGRRWWLLRPDREHKFLTAGFGQYGEVDYVTAAITTDGELAMAYVPSTGKARRELTLDLSQMSAPVAARWYNPASGRDSEIAGAPLANKGKMKLMTPGDNGTGTNDWLLVFEARTARESK